MYSREYVPCTHIYNNWFGTSVFFLFLFFQKCMFIKKLKESHSRGYFIIEQKKKVRLKNCNIIDSQGISIMCIHYICVKVYRSGIKNNSKKNYNCFQRLFHHCFKGPTDISIEIVSQMFKNALPTVSHNVYVYLNFPFTKNPVHKRKLGNKYKLFVFSL